MLVSDAPDPLNVPAVTVPVTASEASVPTEVSEELTTFDASVVPVSVPAAAAPALPFDAAVIRPCASTVMFDKVYEPGVTAVLFSETLLIPPLV